MLAGDFNVIPEPRDAKNPANWTKDALFLPQTRSAYRTLLNLGLTDAVRATTDADGRVHLLGLHGRRLAEERRHTDRPPPAVAPGRRPAEERDNRPARARMGQALRPRAGPHRPALTAMNAPAKPPQFRPPGRMRARIIGLGVTLAPVLVGFALSVFLAGTPPVERLRNITFDQYLRAAPRAWSPDLPVRIVDVDDASLARIGQWPWPRRRIAELTDKLAANGAASIAYDVLFAEPDRYAPGAIISELPDIPEREALRSALEASGSLAADPLAKAFSEAPVVAATALVLRPSEGKDDIANAVKSSFVVLGDDPRPIAPRFAGVVLPLPELRTAVTGLGAINYLSDGDQIIRKAPLLFALGPPGQGILVPSFAVEALRVAFQTDTPIVKSTNASGERAYGGYSAIVAVKIGDAEIPTDADGSVRIRYAGSQPGRLIPAWKVLAGEVDRDEIEGRIVLIGSSAAALSDIRTTPSTPRRPASRSTPNCLSTRSRAPASCGRTGRRARKVSPSCSAALSSHGARAGSARSWPPSRSSASSPSARRAHGCCSRGPISCSTRWCPASRGSPPTSRARLRRTCGRRTSASTCAARSSATWRRPSSSASRPIPRA